MYQAGLVLEGGGMKGVYTAGVLDAFLEQGIEFTSAYGVSAGAIHLLNFLSKQKRRGIRVCTDYLDDPNYCSIRSLLLTGDIFNVEMSYHKIPEKLDPFDYETFQKYQGKAYAVVTNIVTGKPEYIRLKDMKKDIEAVRASASLPLVAQNVSINGKLYLDGGISDAIPLQKSILDGNRKNVVILTKEEGYIRQPDSKLALIKMRYLKYPKVYELMKYRYARYNDTLDFLEMQKKNGQAFVIRPKKRSDVGRIEKDANKLKKLYREGYEDGLKIADEVKAYLES